MFRVRDVCVEYKNRFYDAVSFSEPGSYTLFVGVTWSEPVQFTTERDVTLTVLPKK